jgi:hypothetical protein
MNFWPEYDELHRQASMTVYDHLVAAVESIDRILGEGYAERNPVLVAAFIQACSVDFVSAAAQKTLQEAVRYYVENQNAGSG